jgi:hypothetical protein
MKTKTLQLCGRVSRRKLSLCALALTCLLGLALAASAWGEQTPSDPAGGEPPSWEERYTVVYHFSDDGERKLRELLEGATATSVAAITISGPAIRFEKVADPQSLTINAGATIKLTGVGIHKPVELNANGQCRVIEVKQGGRLFLESIKVTGGNSQDPGGGVYVGENGAFAMNGGTISGNDAFSGGGIYGSNGAFAMNGGKVSGNNAYFGGGVYMQGEFTMQGGVISRNSTNEKGGGVYVYGEFTMEDGEISGNAAKTSGGGVYVQSSSDEIDSSFTMKSGSKIMNNVVWMDDGGGIYTEDYENLFLPVSARAVFGGNKASALYTLANGEESVPPSGFKGSVTAISVPELRSLNNILVKEGGGYNASVFNNYDINYTGGGDDTITSIKTAEGYVRLDANRDTVFSQGVATDGYQDDIPVPTTVKLYRAAQAEEALFDVPTDAGGRYRFFVIYVDAANIVIENPGTNGNPMRFVSHAGSEENEDLTIPANFASLDNVRADAWLQKPFTVTFDANGGTLDAATKNQFVYKGEFAADPGVPIKPGFDFTGWYAVGSETPWIFADAVVSDMILKAVWAENAIPPPCIVIFMDGDTEHTSRQVAQGSTLGDAMPENPARSGYNFDGWYTAPTGGILFTADTPVNNDIIVWARWSATGGGGGGGSGVIPTPGGEEESGNAGEATTGDEGGTGEGTTGEENAASGGTDPSVPPVPARPGDSLIPAPDAENAYIELGEDGVPLGEWHYDDDLGEWIFDEYPPPLGNLPQTGAASAGAGSGSAAWPFFLCALLAAFGLIALTARKRRSDGRP